MNGSERALTFMFSGKDMNICWNILDQFIDFHLGWT